MVFVCCGTVAGRWVTNVATKSRRTNPVVIPRANSEVLGELYLAILIIDSVPVGRSLFVRAVPSVFDHQFANIRL